MSQQGLKVRSHDLLDPAYSCVPSTAKFFYNSSIEHCIKHLAVDSGMDGLAHLENPPLLMENTPRLLKFILIMYLHHRDNLPAYIYLCRDYVSLPDVCQESRMSQLYLSITLDITNALHYY